MYTEDLSTLLRFQLKKLSEVEETRLLEERGWTGGSAESIKETGRDQKGNALFINVPELGTNTSQVVVMSKGRVSR